MVERAEGLNGRIGLCYSGKDDERQGKWGDNNVSKESKTKMGR